MKISFRKTWLLAIPLAAMALPGCTRDYKFQPVDMWNGSRLKPYEEVNFFENRSSAQVPPQNTVARSQDRMNEPMYFGTINGERIAFNPLLQEASADKKDPVKARLAVLERGQERYNIYCQPCHGLGGYGDGIIHRRGFAAPPSYHIPRLQNVPDGYVYDVITNGYGAMYSYASRIPPRDRWAIVAYVRTLQRSQKPSAGDLKAFKDSKADFGGPASGEAAAEHGEAAAEHGAAAEGHGAEAPHGEAAH